MQPENESAEEEKGLLRVAAVQFEPLLGQCERNRRKLVELIEKALSQKAELVVTPELGVSGFVLHTRTEAFKNAEAIPEGPTVSALEEVAKQRNGYIVSGILEKEGDFLYNAAVLVGPSNHRRHLGQQPFHADVRGPRIYRIECVGIVRSQGGDSRSKNLHRVRLLGKRFEEMLHVLTQHRVVGYLVHVVVHLLPGW